MFFSAFKTNILLIIQFSKNKVTMTIVINGG